jgi:hypothetical protein
MSATLNDYNLRKELKLRGVNVGPINESTRRYCVKKLIALRHASKVPSPKPPATPVKKVLRPLKRAGAFVGNDTSSSKRKKPISSTFDPTAHLKAELTDLRHQLEVLNERVLQLETITAGLAN